MSGKKLMLLISILIFSFLSFNTLFAEDANQYFTSGIALFDRGDYTNALTAFRNALDQKSTLAEAQYNIGIIYDIQKKFPEAIQAYERVLQMDPAIGNLFENLVIDTYLIGDVQKSAYYAQMAESKGKPISRKIHDQIFSESRWVGKGTVIPLSALDSGELEGMKKMLETEIVPLEEKIKQMKEPLAKDLLDLAIKYRQIGNTEKAIDLLNRASEQGDNYKIQAELALCYFLSEKGDPFLEHFKKARKLGYHPSVSLSDLYTQSAIQK